MKIQKLQVAEKREQFQLLICRDTITKRIKPLPLVNCDKVNTLHYSVVGSKVQDLSEQS